MKAFVVCRGPAAKQVEGENDFMRAKGANGAPLGPPVLALHLICILVLKNEAVLEAMGEEETTRNQYEKSR